MNKKLLAAGLVAASMTGTSLLWVGAAEARDGRNGAFAAGAGVGVVGGLLLGGALAQPSYAEPTYVEPAPVYVEPACYWSEREVPNRYDEGFHLERVQVCD